MPTSKLFVQTGWSSEYGFQSEPMAETDRLEPNSVYAVAKAAQTHLGQLWARASGDAGRHAAALLGLRAVGGADPADPDAARPGAPRLPLLIVSPDTARDFVYVDDVIEALLDFEHCPGSAARR